MSEKEFLTLVNSVKQWHFGFQPIIRNAERSQLLFDNKTALQEQMSQTHENIQK